MARHKDANWNLPDKLTDWKECELAVLMDIRDEMKKLNRLFECPNFLAIPATLREIKRNTARPRKKRQPKTFFRR